MELNRPVIALMGNPNSGKTAIFNLLTGLNQKVSNYPGITVEQRIGSAQLPDGLKTDILDFPGTYSLTPESMDEKIVARQVMKWMQGEEKPRALISIVDADNLSRNLYLTTQLLDLDIPVIVALNMMDRVKRGNRDIDSSILCEMLGADAVIPLSALEKWGVTELQNAVAHILTNDTKLNPNRLQLQISPEIENHLLPVTEFLKDNFGYENQLARVQALRLITRNSALDLYKEKNGFTAARFETLERIRREVADKMETAGLKHRILEASLRYQMLDSHLKDNNLAEVEEIKKVSRSERADEILTHKWLGPLIFIAILYGIFQSIFTMATVPMDWINTGVGYIGNYFAQTLPGGVLRDLLVEGVIAGVGAIIIFLPQILVLMFFMTLLEDTGYMARVAFMMDRLMNKIGLHGKSVLPLMSGYACAIPGIMATRTIDNWKERLVTILILPLISCSARLPVYTLMIGAFIPEKKVMGIFNLQGVTMVMMYFLGTVTALAIAAFISRFIKEKGISSFVMELPPYRIPLAKSVFRQLVIRGKLFIVNAGKIIMAISIVLWFLASFPKSEANASALPIQESYAGKIGQAIEPFIAPLGFDWKIGVGLITSFAAREVMVSTLATLYNVEEEGEYVVGITEALKNDVNPVTGLPRYTPLVALSIMVFYVYAAQCMATFAIVRNETNTWKWPLIMILYMTGLAYAGSLLVYQGGLMLGFA